MDFHKSKVLLKKINALHDSAEAFDGKFSKLEKDLVLEYLRNLYEVLHDDDDVSKPTPEPAVRQAAVVPPTPQAPVIEPVKESAPVIEEVIVQTPVPEPVKPPVVETPVVKVALDEPVVEAIKEVKVEAPVVAPAVKHQLDTKDLGSFGALFEDAQIQDVSSKFSLKPLADINKGMGINDKILMINSLFGGDQPLFAATVTKLNDFSSFDQAKELIMSGIAEKNDWVSEGKLDTAKRFIQLIRRRYQ